MAYKHNDALHKHQVRARRLRRLAAGITFIILVAGVVIGADWLINQINNTETVVSSENTKSVQSANVSVHRTEYFQFQAPDAWVEIANNSGSGKRFEYVKNNGDLITQKLTVMVDRPAIDTEADFKITRVLPVSIDSEGNFNPLDNVSEHCDESWPNKLRRNPARIVHYSVSFVCDSLSQQYNIVIGENGGSENITIDRNDGTQFSLYIVYSDLTAYPSPGDVYNIVSSFRAL